MRQKQTNLFVIIQSGQNTHVSSVRVNPNVKDDLVEYLDRVVLAVNNQNEQQFVKKLAFEYQAWLQTKQNTFSQENELFWRLVSTYALRGIDQFAVRMFAKNVVVMHIFLPFIQSKIPVSVFEDHELQAFDTLFRSPGKLVVNVSGEWCGPCRRIYPTFENLAKTHHESDVTFARVLVKQTSESFAKVRPWFDVCSIPTFAFVVDGQVQLLSSDMDAEKLQQEVHKFIEA